MWRATFMKICGQFNYVAHKTRIPNNHAASHTLRHIIKLATYLHPAQAIAKRRVSRAGFMTIQFWLAYMRSRPSFETHVSRSRTSTVGRRGWHLCGSLCGVESWSRPHTQGASRLVCLPEFAGPLLWRTSKLDCVGLG